MSSEDKPDKALPTILDAATQQALFSKLLVIELSSKNLAGVWPRTRDGEPVPLSEAQGNQEPP